MTRQEFQERLAALREDVLYLGELVADRLRQAIDAYERKDVQLAEEVIEGDGEVNRLYLELESDCIDLFALQQPVAGDLRLVAASFKIITDLERIGDLATNLARYGIEAERDVYPEVDVSRIAETAVEMLDRALTAYADEDAEACYAVDARDDELDSLCADASDLVARNLLEASFGDEDDVADVLPEARRLLLTVRDLERVGDHAVNVAGRTLYMVENDDELLF
jgi:phosphate transport system protein